MKDDYSKETLFQMELSYKPDAKDDNFSLQLEIDYTEITIAGLITRDKNSFHLRLDELEIDDWIAFGIEYRFENYKGDNVPVAVTVDVADLSMLDLGRIATDLYNRATKWAEGLDPKIRGPIFALF